MLKLCPRILLVLKDPKTVQNYFIAALGDDDGVV